MAIRRTAAPRKRSASQSAVPQRVAEAAAVTESGSAQEASAEDELRQQLLHDFESALREQGDLDQDGFEFLMTHLREAMNDASLQPERQELDRSEWTAAFDALVGDSLDEDERNALVRQLNEAIDPLNSAGVKTASEFAERLQKDGEAAALDWLGKQRQAAQAKAAAKSPLPEKDVVPGRQSITRSRSRRLRGPPI